LLLLLLLLLLLVLVLALVPVLVLLLRNSWLPVPFLLAKNRAREGKSADLLAFTSRAPARMNAAAAAAAAAAAPLPPPPPLPPFRAFYRPVLLLFSATRLSFGQLRRICAGLGARLFYVPDWLS